MLLSKQKDFHNPYRDLFYADTTPFDLLRAPTLEHFLQEPFYQLLRHQLLARQVELFKAGNIDKTVVFHLYHADNVGFLTPKEPDFSTLGSDIYTVWRIILRDTAVFLACDIKKVSHRRRATDICRISRL